MFGKRSQCSDCAHPYFRIRFRWYGNLDLYLFWIRLASQNKTQDFRSIACEPFSVLAEHEKASNHVERPVQWPAILKSIGHELEADHDNVCRDQIHGGHADVPPQPIAYHLSDLWRFIHISLSREYQERLHKKIEQRCWVCNLDDRAYNCHDWDGVSIGTVLAIVDIVEHETPHQHSVHVAVYRAKCEGDKHDQKYARVIICKALLRRHCS